MVVGVFLAATTVLACGDKFVVLGRGVRFLGLHAALHPASILIYMNPASHVPAADKEFQIQSTLKLAGHKPHAVENPGDLGKALSSGSYDLVLGDLSDVAMLERQVETVPTKPAVIPVVYNLTGAELAAAEKEHSCLIKASKKNHELLAVIDEAMQSKSRGSDPKCQKGK